MFDTTSFKVFVQYVTEYENIFHNVLSVFIMNTTVRQVVQKTEFTIDNSYLKNSYSYASNVIV